MIAEISKLPIRCAAMYVTDRYAGHGKPDHELLDVTLCRKNQSESCQWRNGKADADLQPVNKQANIELHDDSRTTWCSE